MQDIIDSYRVFPRIFLVLFTIATGISIDWYLSFPLEYKVECNQELLLGLTTQGHELKAAEEISCRTTEVLGRPAGYTFLISTLIGACGVVFSFYVNSGQLRKSS